MKMRRAVSRMEKMAETKITQEDAAAQTILAMIRESSKEGQLLAESEILRRLADQYPLTPPATDPIEEIEKILKNAVAGSDDLHALAVRDGSRRYYSAEFMTFAYAAILLQKEGDPLRLIAEIVRENSEIYPRPVPLELFAQSPFDLTQQEVLDDLVRMAEKEEYRDIAQTTTSASKVYLYSTLHLEPDHAEMLAEWADVGQDGNP
jgi:hypothetical protein